ncbi:hypothetical protein ACQKP8_00045 [Photobacterium alginatilyticum]|uniref:hypothetical protein n=1 Tax=Photobacterium alginatilyticum TaxID=1775171 RepID=UPI0040686602
MLGIDDINRQSQWQTLLEPYFSELGMICQGSPQGATRVPFNHSIADAIEPFQPEAISFHFGLPTYCAMNTTAPAFPYASIEMAQLRKLAEGRGIDDFSPLWSGQNTTGCKEILASELTRQLMLGITV